MVCVREPDALDRALRRSEVELRTGDELAFAEANMRFHLALVNAAGNPVLSGLMRTISARMTWLFYLTAARDHETACREHAAIVEAVVDECLQVVVADREFVARHFTLRSSRARPVSSIDRNL